VVVQFDYVKFPDEIDKVHLRERSSILAWNKFEAELVSIKVMQTYAYLHFCVYVNIVTLKFFVRN